MLKNLHQRCYLPAWITTRVCNVMAAGHRFFGTKNVIGVCLCWMCVFEMAWKWTYIWLMPTQKISFKDRHLKLPHSPDSSVFCERRARWRYWVKQDSITIFHIIAVEDECSEARAFQKIILKSKEKENVFFFNGLMTVNDAGIEGEDEDMVMFISFRKHPVSEKSLLVLQTIWWGSIEMSFTV